MKTEEFKLYQEFSDAAEVTRNELRRILEKEFPEPRKKFRMLDVGANDGRMILPLLIWLETVHSNFQYDAIEPDEEAFFAQKKDLKKVARCLWWMDLKEFMNCTAIFDYDLILYSHCFYYFPMHEWTKIINWTLRRLKPKGKVIIILDSVSSEIFELKQSVAPGRLLDTYANGDIFFAEEIEDYLARRRIQFSSRPITTLARIPENEESVYNLARILAFLYRTFPEKLVENHKRELEVFLQKYKQDQCYCIKNAAKAVVFPKEGQPIVCPICGKE